MTIVCYCRFVNRALMLVLEDWLSIRSCLLCQSREDINGGVGPVGGAGGGGGGGGVGREGGEWPFVLSQGEQQRILKAQKTTNYLDSFTYTLLTKTTHSVSKQLYCTCTLIIIHIENLNVLHLQYI